MSKRTPYRINIPTGPDDRIDDEWLEATFDDRVENLFMPEMEDYDPSPYDGTYSEE